MRGISGGDDDGVHFVEALYCFCFYSSSGCEPPSDGITLLTLEDETCVICSCRRGLSFCYRCSDGKH